MARFDYLDILNIEGLLGTYFDEKEEKESMERKIAEGRTIGIEESEYINVDIPTAKAKMDYIIKLIEKKPKEEILSAERFYQNKVLEIDETVSSPKYDPRNDFNELKKQATQYGESIVILRDILDKLGYEDIYPYSDKEYSYK